MFGVSQQHSLNNFKLNQSNARVMRFFCEKNMVKQVVNLGTAPSGTGGDTSRSATTKLMNNVNELYAFAGADAAGALPSFLPVNKGGTGGGSATDAKKALGLGDAGFTGWTAGVIASLFNITTVSGFTNVLGQNRFFGVSNGDWQQGSVANSLYMPQRYGSLFGYQGVDSLGTYSYQIFRGVSGKEIFYRYGSGADLWSAWQPFRTGFNSVADANGFLKSASPICDLYVDLIELNDEAKLQDISFERVDVGEYLIKGSLGFAQEGWYIETPKDANGNVLFSVVYEQLENNDISVKTYKKKFDIETASIIADLDKPIDITEGRFISLRLQELPQDDTESIAPPDFQPTNLSQAISEMMNGSQQ